MDKISLERILRKELDAERAKTEELEQEIVLVKSLLSEFEENIKYPSNINACLRDVHKFLADFKKANGKSA